MILSQVLIKPKKTLKQNINLWKVWFIKFFSSFKLIWKGVIRNIFSIFSSVLSTNSSLKQSPLDFIMTSDYLTDAIPQISFIHSSPVLKQKKN